MAETDRLATRFPKLAYPIEEAADAVGVSRTRLFEAIRNQELTARKAGRATIVEVVALLAWLRSLPTRGKSLDGEGANGT